MTLTLGVNIICSTLAWASTLCTAPRYNQHHAFTLGTSESTPSRSKPHPRTHCGRSKTRSPEEMAQETQSHVGPEFVDSYRTWKPQSPSMTCKTSHEPNTIPKEFNQTMLYPSDIDQRYKILHKSPNRGCAVQTPLHTALSYPARSPSGPHPNSSYRRPRPRALCYSLFK